MLTSTLNLVNIKTMKKVIQISIAVITLLLILSPRANAQTGGIYGESFYYEKSSFFVTVGWLNGPTFKDYVNWANEAYAERFGSTETLDDFGGSFCLSLGLRSRFSRYFAFEVDFLTSSKNKKQSFSVSGQPPIPIEMDLTIGAITFSLPVIFQFSSHQPIVPFVAAGATIFPLRFDHRIGYTIRHTKTAVAGNFAAGLDFRIIPRWWVTARADWTFGKANMPVSQTYDPPNDKHYEIDLSTTSFQIGIVRGLY